MKLKTACLTSATAVAAILAGVAPVAGAAGAAGAAPGGDEVTVTPKRALPGDEVRVQAQCPERTVTHRVVSPQVLDMPMPGTGTAVDAKLTILSGAPEGKVVTRTLHVRSGVDTKARIVGTVRGGQILNLECKTPGQNIRGNRLWYKIADVDSQWVSARYVKNLNRVPSCPV